MTKFITSIFQENFNYHFPLLLILGSILFIPFLGRVHLFDWDEINFAESAREMLVSGNYTQVQINFQPFWEKPPFFFWLQALSMHVFGVNEFAARFPNAICGLLTLSAFYFIGKKLYSNVFGFIWSLAYLGSFLPHFYFKSAIIDPFFNLFIFLGIYFLAQGIHYYKHKKALKYIVWSGFFTGIAVLTKGPVGLLLVLLTFLVFWSFNRFKPVSTIFHLLIFAFVVFAVSCLWYGVELLENGIWFFKEFFEYHIRLFSTPDAGHGQPFYYHFIVVFIGCFPLSIFAIPVFYTLRRVDLNNVNKTNFNTNIEKNNFESSIYQNINLRKWSLYIFWVVMILFSLSKTKIVHYSSMAYLPLSFLAAFSLYYFLKSEQKIPLYLRLSLAVTGTLFGILLVLIPIFGIYKDKFIPYIKDDFVVNSLSVDMGWQGWEWIIGFFYIVLIWISVFQFRKGRLKAGSIIIFLSTAFCIFIYLLIVVPKIEAFSQRPTIEFYKSLEGKNVYVTTIGFKSYAHLFYFKIPKYQNPNYYQQEQSNWLLEGNIDKDAYFVVKNVPKKLAKLEPYKDIEKVYEKGGFVFFRRSHQK